MPASVDDDANVPTAIVYHGITSCGRMMGHVVKMFHNLGMHVLVPDMRGHGRSDEDCMNWSILDSSDCISWIKDERIKSQKLYLFGVSLGGSIVWKAAFNLCNTAEYKDRIRLIVDAASPDMEIGIAAMFNNNTEWSALDAFNKLIVTYKFSEILRNEQGVTLNDALHLTESITSKCGILLIHGLADTSIPPQSSEFVYEIYQSTPKSKFFVENANHPQSMWWKYDEYHTSVSDFITMP